MPAAASCRRSQQVPLLAAEVILDRIGLSATVFSTQVETADDLRRALTAGGALSVRAAPDGDEVRGGLGWLRSLFRG